MPLSPQLCNTQRLKFVTTPSVPADPLSNHRRRELSAHIGGHIIATKDPNPFLTSTPQSPIFTCSVVVPNPIVINPLRSLRTIASAFLSLGEARERTMTEWIRALSLSLMEIWGERFGGKSWDISPTAENLYASAANLFSQNLKSKTAGLSQPTSINSFGLVLAQLLITPQPTNTISIQPATNPQNPDAFNLPTFPSHSLITPITKAVSFPGLRIKPLSSSFCPSTARDNNYPSAAPELFSQIQLTFDVSQPA